jgi:hypothetical protein
MSKSVAKPSVAVVVFNALRKLLESKAVNAGFLREWNDLLLRLGGRYLQESLGLFFSAAGQFGHKLEPCRFAKRMTKLPSGLTKGA